MKTINQYTKAKTNITPFKKYKPDYVANQKKMAYALPTPSSLDMYEDCRPDNRKSASAKP